ncbi:MAG TPA: hypothetical protein VJP79_10645 [Nitrososphaera sp.]|nr:hypothetical protein [Nitrososphaera sp.]
MPFYKGRHSWARRRWLDFRQGHGIYLAFVITFANFITIQYSLMIERIPAFNLLFSNVWVFVVAFIAVYMPVAIIIGYWHRKSQWKVEQEAMFNENVVQASMYLFLINLIEGKATEKERRDMKLMLERIIRKPPKSKDTSEAA